MHTQFTLTLPIRSTPDLTEELKNEVAKIAMSEHMANRKHLLDWLVEALKAKHGSARVVDICRYIWDKYESELRRSGDLFYRWQYDIRWAATQLRKDGVMRASRLSPRGIWELA